jgi:hypothetical protein
MKRLNRVLAGALSLALGAATIWLAIGFYRTGAKLAALAGGSPGQEYALVLVLAGFGATFIAIAYAYLFRKPKA